MALWGGEPSPSPPARRQQSQSQPQPQPQPQLGSVHSGSQSQHTMVSNIRKSPPLTVGGAPAARQRRWAILRRQRRHHGHHLLAQSAQPGHLFIQIGKPATQQFLSRFAGADTGIADCQQVLDVAELQLSLSVSRRPVTRPGRVRDEEVAGSNPVTPTTKGLGEGLARPKLPARGSPLSATDQAKSRSGLGRGGSARCWLTPQSGAIVSLSWR